MDQYAAADLVEIYYLARSSMDAQFQFWVSITFAVIVAAFVAGIRLPRTLRYVISLLYLLATVVLVLLFTGDAQSALNAVSALRDGDASMLIVRPGGPVLGLARYALFLIGTASALYFLVRSYKSDFQVEN